MNTVKISDIVKGKAKEAFDYCFESTNEHDNNTHINIFAIDKSCQSGFEKRQNEHNFKNVSAVMKINDEPDCDIPSDWDIYITKNMLSDGIKDIGRRCFKDFKAIKNVVIDLDCHDLSADSEAIKSKFIEYYDEIFSDIPEPTVIYWTGRGFHIWYNLETASFEESEPVYRAVSEKLAHMFEDYLRLFELAVPGLEIDAAASKCSVGLVRLFGSHNSKARIEPEICVFNKIRYNLTNLSNVLGAVIEDYPRQSNPFSFEAVD